jgi:LysR family transcriptional regulator for bpeEF and oprC
MDFLFAMRVVDAVGHHGSFAAAARAMNLSTPSVSRLVSELESHLGVRLFNRTTRRISPTESGYRFLQRSGHLLEDVESLLDETRATHRAPTGTLKVSCVNAFGIERVAPAMPEFLSRYPGIALELDISNRKVNLIDDNFDIAIRIGGDSGLEDSTLVARKIFGQRLIFVATPEYVEKNGKPKTLKALSRHRTVRQVSGNWGLVHHLARAGKVVDYQLSGAFTLNSPIAARNVVLTGYGCGLIADYLVEADIAAGRLVRLLPRYATTEQSVYAVYAHRKYVPARVRLFVEFLVEYFAKAPDNRGNTD